MAVTSYKSTDVGSPILTGQAGSLLALLNTVLIGNGVAYGAKNASGWIKSFADAANKGCYKGGTGNQLGLLLDDSAGQSVAGAREALFRGEEVLTSASAGTNPFPTVAQEAGTGMVIRKSRTADATAVPWKVFADDRTFYLFIDTPDFTGYGAYMFGEYFSQRSGDGFRTMIVGRKNSAGNTLAANDVDDNMQNLFSPAVAPGTNQGHYAARDIFGNLGSVVVGKHGDGVFGINQLSATTNRIGNGLVMYPNPSDGGAVVAQLVLQDALGSEFGFRGHMRGMFQWCHPVAVAGTDDGQQFAGSGSLAGHTLEIVKPIARGDGLYVIDVTGPWDTSA